MKKGTRILTALGAAAALVLAPAAAASALTIDSPGPLVRIDISDTLNCAVNHAGDLYGEFYDDTACGTFAAVNGVVYGPSTVPAGSGSRDVAWTPVSQTQSGDGTAATPAEITTVVSGGGVEVRQVDSYVYGEHLYRTISEVTNTTDADVEVTLYHAADCYLGDNDYGFGAYDPATGAVNCAAPDSTGGHSSASRIEQFIPYTPASNYFYSTYSAVWDAVGSGLPLTNVVENAGTEIDNGMALSWTVPLAPGASYSFAMATNFSPFEVAALDTTLTVDPATLVEGEEATVTATVNNPNDGLQDLHGAVVTLPAGLEYIADSATVLGEPTITDDGTTAELVFDGSGQTIEGHESLTFTFTVRATAVGDYEVGLAASVESRADVAPSTATVSVVVPTVESSLTVAPGEVTVGTSATLTGTFTNPYATPLDLLDFELDLTDDTAYVDGSVTGASAPVVNGNSLLFAGPVTIPANGAFSFTVDVSTNAVGAQTFTLTGASTDATVLSSTTSLNVVAATTPPVGPDPVDPVTPVDPSPQGPTTPPATTPDLAATGAPGPSGMGGLVAGTVAGLMFLAAAAVFGIRAARRDA